MNNLQGTYTPILVCATGRRQGRGTVSNYLVHNMPTDQLSTTFAALSKHLGVHVVDWAERYRHTWEARLDRLDSYLQQIRPKERTRGRQPRRKSR